MDSQTIIRVRVCEECGAVANAMDTLCPGCRRRGTLQDRRQCRHCGAVFDESACPRCGTSVAIQAVSPLSEEEPDRLNLDLPDFRTDSRETVPPPWVVGAVGGAVLGAAGGALFGLFLDEIYWITALIGLVLGALVGALSSGHGERRP